MAEEALLDFAEDEMLDGDRRYFAAIVNDEARQEVLRVTLSLAEEGPLKAQPHLLTERDIVTARNGKRRHHGSASFAGTVCRLSN
jgi:hypothetical protein